MQTKHTELQLKKLALVLFLENIDAYNCKPIYDKHGLTPEEVGKVEKYYDALFS